MQCLPSSLLQEVQQQGEIETQQGSRRARSQERRTRRPAPSPLQAKEHVTSKSDFTSSSPPPFCSDTKPLSLSLGPIQQRTPSYTARDRDGQESAALPSSLEQRRSSSGEAWWLPATQEGKKELVGGRTQTSSSMKGPERAHVTTTTPDIETPATGSTKHSDDSQASSIAYITQDRRQDFRLMRVPDLVAKNKALFKLEKDIMGKGMPKNTSIVTKPMIVEDSQDYITAKSPPKTKAARPARDSPLASSPSSKAYSLSTSSSTMTIFSKAKPTNRRARGSEIGGGVRSDSDSTLTSSRRQSASKRPLLSRFHTTNYTQDPFARPTSEPASPKHAPHQPTVTSVVTRRQSAPWSMSSPTARDSFELPQTPGNEIDIPSPSFQPDEQYFEAIASAEQQSLHHTTIPDSVSQPSIKVSRPPTTSTPGSPFVSQTRSRLTDANTRRRKCRSCFQAFSGGELLWKGFG